MDGRLKYEGNFIKGQYFGKGKYYSTMSDNSIHGKLLYEGDFAFDSYDGKGRYYYNNGKYNIGSFKNGKRNVMELYFIIMIL